MDMVNYIIIRNPIKTVHYIKTIKKRLPITFT